MAVTWGISSVHVMLFTWTKANRCLVRPAVFDNVCLTYYVFSYLHIYLFYMYIRLILWN